MKKGIRSILKLGRNKDYDQAMAAYNSSRYEEALSGFSKVEAAVSESSLHGSLARFYRALTRRNLGLLDLHRGENKRAADHLREASRLLKDDPRLDYLCAVALSRAGEHGPALAGMEKAALGLKGTRIQVTLALMSLNAGQAEAALELLQPLVAANPLFPDLRYHLAHTYIRLERIGEAVDQLETALRINPLYYHARMTLGRVLGLLGQEDRALELLEEERADPGRWKKELMAPCPVARGFGELLNRLEKSDQGLLKTLALIFEEAVAEHPEWPDQHYHLGLIYHNLEQWDLALAAYNQACKINPYYSQACEALNRLLKEMGGGGLLPEDLD